jgi:acyl transferase domain-containing protein/NADPH:quinone reductase-like Zn-dependent oxidoreductase/acyl carrier protein
VAGVMKMTLALQHQVLPRTLHADEASTHVDWQAGGVRLLTEPVPWPAGGGRPRRAGVSSFGVSGTNAHVIVEEAPAAGPAAADHDAVVAGPVVSGVVPWLVSGRSVAGLRGQAGRLAEFTVARPEVEPADTGWSLAVSRSVFAHRAVVMGSGRGELAAGLGAVAAGQESPLVVSGVVPAGGAGRVGLLFAGQGSQRAGMGRELHAASGVFAAGFDRACGLLEDRLGMPVREVVLGPGDDARADQTVFAQAGLLAVQAGLVALLGEAGITVDAVAGHSVGEVAAAYAAGVLSLEDACALVAARAAGMQALPGGGAMASVALGEDEVLAEIGPLGGGVSVAAVNGPASVVVSGEEAGVEQLVARWRERGVRARRLRVSHAFHSALMDPVLAGLEEAAARLAHQPARVPWAQALTGQVADGCEPGYWAAAARRPVRFADAVAALAAQGVSVFVEAGPDGTLCALAASALAGQDAEFIPLLRREREAPGAVMEALGRLHVRGVKVDWPAVLGQGRKVDLPTYAFQRQRFWPAPARVAGDVSSAGLGAVGHPLLGAAVELAGGRELVLTGRLSARSQPWLGDHVITGSVLLPGTAFVELAVRAADQAGCGRVAELALEAPLVLAGDEAADVQVVVGGADEGGQRPVEVFSRPAGRDGAWARHASGLLAPAAGADAGQDPALSGAWPPPGAVPVPVDGAYERLAEGGYQYGPAFRGLRAVWRRGQEIFAEAALPEDAAADAGSFGLHPALLDAVLHAGALAGAGEAEPGVVRLPFAWQGVSLHASGAKVLRARLAWAGRGGMRIVAADGAGQLVVSVEALVSRPVAAGQLDAGRGGLRDAVFTVDWAQVPAGPAAASAAVIGDDGPGLAQALAAAGTRVRAYPALAALAADVAAGAPVPEVALACAPGGDAAAAAMAGAVTGQVLGLVQDWLAEDKLAAARLVLVTRGAVAAVPGEDVADLAQAAACGLVRSAQSENPGRLVLADLPAGPGGEAAGMLAAALGSGEPEVAVRGRELFGRRLARPPAVLAPPAGAQPWRLAASGGTLDSLALVPCPEAAGPLAAGQVRVAVRAAGLNFRDVLIGLDMYPGAAVMGSEIAGVVTEAGPGVTGLAPGDRVLGMTSGGFGPVAVTDARLLAPVPPGWSFAQAAAVPVAYMTAWYALAGLAGARPGQRLLVHAATGGVGMAAVAIARHLGLEVYGTASPAKWAVLRQMGLDEEHIASSRDAGFEGKLLAATGGAGMDLVLNALAGELTDASLRLLPRGGTFLEMGKTDIRDPGTVTAAHPGVCYRPFDVSDAGPEAAGEILAEVTGLLARGQLAPAPVRAWEVRQAREAFRFMSQARHTGKIVLTIPPGPAAPRPAATVLVTGGTGMLGSLAARHLAGQAALTVLASRSGPAAPGAAALAADLARSGTAVQVTACDTADRGQLAALLAALPAGTPLTTVVHTAGTVDDGVTASLTPARVAAVMRPKAIAAWNLHELTAGHDLSAFVMYSSAAATFGGPGQGNYAAANAFLDALAARRAHAGLPATALAWGLWEGTSAITGHLTGTDRARMARGGMDALTAGQGLALLDQGTARPEPALVAARLNLAALTDGTEAPPLLRNIARRTARRTAASTATADSLREQLAALPATERGWALLALARAHVAAVLGHASAEAIGPDQAFTDLGFDSLTAVELRNRLDSATGLRLPSTLVFDYPTPAALVGYLREKLSPGDGGDTDTDPAEGKVRKALESIPMSRLRAAGLMDALLRLAEFPGNALAPDQDGKAEAIDSLDAESLIRMAFDSET